MLFCWTAQLVALDALGLDSLLPALTPVVGVAEGTEIAGGVVVAPLDVVHLGGSSGATLVVLNPPTAERVSGQDDGADLIPVRREFATTVRGGPRAHPGVTDTSEIHPAPEEMKRR